MGSAARVLLAGLCLLVVGARGDALAPATASRSLNAGITWVRTRRVRMSIDARMSPSGSCPWHGTVPVEDDHRRGERA